MENLKSKEPGGLIYVMKEVTGKNCHEKHDLELQEDGWLKCKNCGCRLVPLTDPFYIGLDNKTKEFIKKDLIKDTIFYFKANFLN